VARVLLVGCGCRGGELAAALIERGHAVRGTTRDESRFEAIAAAGAEAALADPGRLMTLMPHVEGVSVLCWLLGSAEGEEENVSALHGPRLETLTERLVDTHVRGVVYEGAGSVAPELLEQGAALVRRANETWNVPVEVVAHDPADRPGWVQAMAAAVERVLSA
jgi:nucleoside-diphosphate-sugar epimerase